MAKILDLIYRVKDTASLPLKKIKGEQEGFNKSLKDGQKQAMAVVGAFTAVGATVTKLISDYQDFTIKVGDVAHNLQVSTEEASAMIEIGADLGIEVQTLQAGFKAMAKNGIDPSIAGLSVVRQRLAAAHTPAERLALATKLLGKAGQDLMPILDQLTDEQLAGFAEGMTKAQIVSEEEYQQALKNRASIDAMSDAWESAKLSVGGFLTNGLIPYVDILKAWPDVVKTIVDPTWRLEEAADHATDKVEGLRSALASIPPLTEAQVVTYHADVQGWGPGGTGQQHPTYIAGGFYMVWDGIRYVRGNKVTIEGGLTGGGLAEGGPVGGGQSVLVGERGPELFTPGQSGNVSSNDDLAALTKAINRMVATLPTILRDAVQKA